MRAEIVMRAKNGLGEQEGQGCQQGSLGRQSGAQSGGQQSPEFQSRGSMVPDHNQGQLGAGVQSATPSVASKPLLLPFLCQVNNSVKTVIEHVGTITVFSFSFFFLKRQLSVAHT